LKSSRLELEDVIPASSAIKIGLGFPLIVFDKPFM
jgi:hypothetical protein